MHVSNWFKTLQQIKMTVELHTMSFSKGLQIYQEELGGCRDGLLSYLLLPTATMNETMNGSRKYTRVYSISPKMKLQNVKNIFFLQDLCNHTGEEDELHYASVHFSKNQTDPVYSNTRLAGVHRHKCEEEVVEYTAIKFNKASAAQR